MKSWHRRIGCAYRDDARESHDHVEESPNTARDYRIAMKSLFMRAQQAPCRAARGERRRGQKPEKRPQIRQLFARWLCGTGVRGRGIDACVVSLANV